MYLGIDTSNYTTSLALFDGKNIIQSKKILSVKEGERGLRQSDAVFQHTVNIPELLKKIDYNSEKIDAIGVTSRPRDLKSSYMPCFTVGLSTAAAVSKFTCAPFYTLSHQCGHILAALYSADKLELLKEPFIAFHISGGTTEALLVTPDNKKIISTQIVSESLDLKAGQAVDRTGVFLGLRFPCGSELDLLSQKSQKTFKVKPTMIGMNFSLSGVENKVKNMIASGESNEDISKFLFCYLSAVVEEVCKKIITKYGQMPILFVGGVVSNSYIRKNIENKFTAFFAEPQFSCDNAAGAAVYAFIKENNIK